MSTATENAPETIVLIGHGMVGQRFLEELADRGVTQRARVVVLCEEPRAAYDRVHLTSYFSGSSPDELSMVPEGFMEQHGIELHTDDPATAVDREARTVTARSGRTFRYDALVLATGSYPFVPPVPGKDSAGCFVYRTIEDVLAIEEYAKNCRAGLVVGGGLLGLEAAGALKGLGLETHIVEFNPRLMSIQVDEGGGAALRRTVEDMGLIVHTGVGGQEINADGDGAVTGMVLSDGSTVATDLVVFSAGVRPGTSSPGRRAWRSGSAAASWWTSSAGRRPTRRCSRSASARGPWTAWCTDWSRRATRWPWPPPGPSRTARRGRPRPGRSPARTPPPS